MFDTPWYSSTWSCHGLIFGAGRPLPACGRAPHPRANARGRGSPFGADRGAGKGRPWEPHSARDMHSGCACATQTLRQSQEHLAYLTGAGAAVLPSPLARSWRRHDTGSATRPSQRIPVDCILIRGLSAGVISRFPCNGSVSLLGIPGYICCSEFDSEQYLFASLLHGAASHRHLAGTSCITYINVRGT